MKRASVAIVLLLAMIGCGGSSKTTVPSKLTDRAFVTNSFGGYVGIIDATKDALTSSVSTGTGSEPTLMALSPTRDVTVVLSAGKSAVVVNNGTEAVEGSIQLLASAEDLVVKDSGVAFAAMPTAEVFGESSLGAVAKLDLRNRTTVDCYAGAGSRSLCLSVPRARHLVLSPKGNVLLAFSDDSNSVTVINTADFTARPIIVSGFNRPVNAVFTTDESKAYIMNCGTQCGGTEPSSVQVLNVNVTTTGSTTTVAASDSGSRTPVSAATVGLLSGSTLYVAGSIGGAYGAGRLTMLDVAGTPTVSGTAVTIGDGYHRQMALASNNKLFIGARDCTNNPNDNAAAPTGCLTIFDTSSKTVVIDTAKDPATGIAKGFVTGMAPLANRNFVYVVSGGQLRIYDTTTSAISTGRNIDIVGTVVDVKTIDQ